MAARQCYAPVMFDARDWAMIVRRMIAYWLLIAMAAAIVVLIIRSRRR